MNIILETGRLVVREWTPEDAGAMFEFAGDAEVMRYIGDGKPMESLAEAERWVESTIACYGLRGYGRWAVVEKASGKVVGSCGFGPLDGLPEIDFGYVFARAAWGRGYATEAARACLLYGLERLGLKGVMASVTPEHAASRRVLEKIGFEYRGLRRFDGEDEDSAYYVAKVSRTG